MADFGEALVGIVGVLGLLALGVGALGDVVVVVVCVRHRAGFGGCFGGEIAAAIGEAAGLGDCAAGHADADELVGAGCCGQRQSP